MEASNGANKPAERGRSADIYLQDDGKILKLFFAGTPQETAALEYANTLEAHALGCTPMRCYELVEQDGRFGLTLEQMSGIPMTKLPNTNPLTLLTAPKQLASVHLRVHGAHTQKLRSARDTAVELLDTEPLTVLSSEERARMKAYLATLDEGDTVLHLDLHTDNILVDGKSLVAIDWMTAMRGAREIEVGMMQFLFHDAELFPGSTPAQLKFYQAVRSYMFKGYFKHYNRAMPVDLDAVRRYKPIPLIIRRGLWNIPFEADVIASQLRALLSELA